MQRLRADGWGRLIRVLAPLGALIVEGWPALVVALIVQEGGLWLATRLVEPCEPSSATASHATSAPSAQAASAAPSRGPAAASSRTAMAAAEASSADSRQATSAASSSQSPRLATSAAASEASRRATLAAALRAPKAASKATAAAAVSVPPSTAGVQETVATSQATFARRLFLAAYGLRMAVALPTHYFAKLGDGNGALFQDDYTNDLVGEWLVRIARGDGIAIFTGHQHLLDGVYPYLLMGIYALFGYAPLLPKLLNSGLAALSAVLIFEMTRRAFHMRAAIIAALGAAILPTMVIWSVVSLKESLVLFAALLGLWVVQTLLTIPARSTRIADAVVVLLAVVTLLLDLRSTLALLLLGLLVIVALARSQYRWHSWQIGFAVVAVLVVAGSGLWFARARSSDRPITSVVEDVVLQIRHRRAQEAASARSQLRPEGDVLSATGSELPVAAEAAADAAPFTVTNDILDPLGYALLAPAPWQARSLPELGASAEMPAWYVLLAASLLAWRAKPQQRLFVLCVVVYGIANWLMLAVSEGNLGNLLRHRLTLDPVLLILGSAGLEWLWGRAGRPFSTHLPAALRPARVDA